jgi:hypothetical protein
LGVLPDPGRPCARFEQIVAVAVNDHVNDHVTTTT